MKLYNVSIGIPYFDEQGYKQWTRIHISGVINHRRIWRGVRKFVQDNFGKTINNDWVKLNCIITGGKLYNHPMEKCLTEKMKAAQKVDELYMKAVEQYEADIKANPALAEGDLESAELEMRPVLGSA